MARKAIESAVLDMISDRKKVTHSTEQFYEVRIPAMEECIKSTVQEIGDLCWYTDGFLMIVVQGRESMRNLTEESFD